MQYVDDTIMFTDCELELAKNLKEVLTCFEQVSGMRISYDNFFASIIQVLGCSVGAFPIKYLGIPPHYYKLRRADLQPLIDKILKRIAGWRGKLLSYAAGVILIKTCLASIPIYMISFFKFPKCSINVINI